MANSENILAIMQGALLHSVPEFKKASRGQRFAPKLLGARQTIVRSSRWLSTFLLLLLLSVHRLPGETGYGGSRSFILDTRAWPDFGVGDSGLFTLDTRSSLTASVAVSGRVVDNTGSGLANASVAAVAFNLVVASVSSDASGYYSMPLLPPGAYEIRAMKLSYLTGVQVAGSLSTGQSTTVNFALAPQPAPPLIQQVAFVLGVSDRGLSGDLRLWTNGGWVAGRSLDRAKTSIILTHGWNSSSDYWPSIMAANLYTNFGGNVNIAAWDWRDSADTGSLLSLAFYGTPRVGKALALKLAADLPSGSRPRLHFIGHSLGTLVNAKAADYLHETVSPPFDWQKTHMTLLDNAVLANVEGAVVSSGFNLAVAGGELATALTLGGVVWQTPNQAEWIDNYISLLGQYSPKAVNVLLEEGAAYLLQQGKLNPNPKNAVEALHGYACDWYAQTVSSPSSSPLGNRYSFEALGGNPNWPTPSPYAQGSVLVQNSSIDELALEPLQVALSDAAHVVAQRAATLSQQVFDRTVDAVGHTVEAVGAVAVAAVDEAADGLSSAWGLGVRLTTFSIALAPLAKGFSPSDAAGPTNFPAYARMTVTVPSNAATLTFSFVLEGDGRSDSFLFGINGTNIVSLETEFIPQAIPVPSGPIDVSAWKGQDVVMEFGISGGTSTNASITVKYLHFNIITAPTVKLANVDNGTVLSWPITATGYGLEFSGGLEPPVQWSSVTNAPGVRGFEQVVTNAFSATNQFYRLRKQ